MKGPLSLLVIGFALSYGAQPIRQGNAIVEISNVQTVSSISALVTDPAGVPVSGVRVEEMSPDWKHSLRTTKTNATGVFNLAPTTGRKAYYLQLTKEGLDLLRVRLKLALEIGRAQSCG